MVVVMMLMSLSLVLLGDHYKHLIKINWLKGKVPLWLVYLLIFSCKHMQHILFLEIKPNVIMPCSPMPCCWLSVPTAGAIS